MIDPLIECYDTENGAVVVGGNITDQMYRDHIASFVNESDAKDFCSKVRYYPLSHFAHLQIEQWSKRYSEYRAKPIVKIEYDIRDGEIIKFNIRRKKQ